MVRHNELVPRCERVDKLSAICAYCSRPAAFTMRLSAETELVSIGGADKYVAVCRRHYFEHAGGGRASAGGESTA